MAECQNCGYEPKLEGRFCPKCKQEVKKFDLNFRKKTFKTILLGTFWLGFMLVVISWWITQTDFDDLQDYMFLIILPLIGFLFILMLFVLIEMIKNKDKEPDANKLMGINNQDLQYFDNSEVIQNSIKFLNRMPSNYYVNLYFTDKRVIVFNLGKPKMRTKKAFAGLNEKDMEADLIKDDLEKFLDFSPFNFVIPYSEIDEVVVKKNIIQFTTIFRDSGRKRHIAFFIASFSKEEKRSSEEYIPMLMKYFSSKIKSKYIES